jgi:hypothetical protein
MHHSIVSTKAGGRPCTLVRLRLQGIPFKEQENIGLLVEEILDLHLDSQVIIVHDNSPDGSGGLAKPGTSAACTAMW